MSSSSGQGHFTVRPDFTTLHQQLAKRSSIPPFDASRCSSAAGPSTEAASGAAVGQGAARSEAEGKPGLRRSPASTSSRRSRYRANSSGSEDDAGAAAARTLQRTGTERVGGGGMSKRKSVAFGSSEQRYIPARGLSSYDAERALDNGVSGDSRKPSSSPSRFAALRLGRRKLGTFDGVYIPTCLNIIGIILFLRFGFIIGQAGLLGALGLLLLAYLIDITTVFSLSAIATNGQVRGGGAYYLISRSLGPEFGGGIGLVFCLGQALNAAMNLLGFVESLVAAFGYTDEQPWGFLPVGRWLKFAYASIALLACALICMVGSSAFSRLTSFMAVIVAASLTSIWLSFLLKQPFSDSSRRAVYTSFSGTTLRNNLFPSFTKDAAGSSMPLGVKDSFQSTFGVLFPSVNGILAGASLSGELRKPSKSIPKGTIWALESIFVIYVLVFLGLASTVPRETFLHDLAVLKDISIAPSLVVCGILVSTFFSALMGMTACGKILQAIARDNLIPWLSPFQQGTERGDDPIFAILAAYVVCQLTLLSDNVNNIASLVTMATLLVFTCVNLACATLKVGGSPNFRPSFRLFSEWTALAGLVLAFAAMYFVDAVAASTALVFFIVLFCVIHYSSPPKQWGEVTQSLIYHQVRKYLLRLDERKHNVKYWRPQILLFTNNPRHDWNSIIFCNSLKKGGLYVLGHVLKGDLRESFADMQVQVHTWLRLVDISGIKAFVDMTAASDERLGCRNLLMTSGLGGMRPNICILGFPEHAQWRHRYRAATSSPAGRRASDAESDTTVRGAPPAEEGDELDKSIGDLPTDAARSSDDSPIKTTDFCGTIEDALLLKKAVGLTYGFRTLSVPPATREAKRGFWGRGRKKEPMSEKMRYIDIWPILLEGDSAWETYTMVLQLGTILSFAPSWKKSHSLRVTVFCEHPHEVAEEKKRMQQLLDNLRIRAALRVCPLADGSLRTYDCLVNGVENEGLTSIEDALGGDPWWETLKFMRSGPDVNASPTKPGSRRAHRPSDPGQAAAPNFGNLARSARTNNLRVQGIHPQSYPDDEDDDEIEAESEDEFEDDNEAARAAYRRTRALTFSEGLPDEPRRPLLMQVQRGYGSSDISPQSVPARRSSHIQDTPLAISPDAVAALSPATAAQAPVIPTKSDSLPAHDEGGRNPPIRGKSSSLKPSSPSFPRLDFNSLPIRAQFVCLNELIRLHSDDQTAVIFTSLPPPEAGVGDSYEKSSRYLQDLNSFFVGLPPVLAINGRQMSVTTNL